MQYCYSLRLGAAVAATRSIRVLGNKSQPHLRRGGLASATASRTADPALHAGNYESDPAVTTGDPQGREKVTEEQGGVDERLTEWDEAEEGACSWSGCKAGKGREALVPPNRPSYRIASSPRLESIAAGVNLEHLIPSNYTQKRPKHVTAAPAGTGSSSSSSFDHLAEKVSCAGLDGTPWPDDKAESAAAAAATSEYSDEDKGVEDYRHYYKHHKASPLSEIEFADTRKPITQAMDNYHDQDGKDVIGWRPEQLDTAEEALARAARIWKENAVRGDPDAPHSRVLRALRGDPLQYS